MKIFRLFLIGVFFIVFNNIAHAQLNVGYNHSNLGSYVSTNYQFKKLNRFESGLRIALDNYIEDLHIEPVVQYHIFQKQDYSFYSGVGLWIDEVNFNLILPIGLNIAPFENKQFQFNAEVTPIFINGTIVRGSIGIRYQFSSN